MAAACCSSSSKKARIAVFCGPQSTIGNSAPLRTSNLARKERGLEPMRDRFGDPLKYDALRLQRLAAPVEVLIAQFSEHPLASDSAELHGPPDGWCDPKTGEFSLERTDGWTPCFKAVLRPEDGLYPLPFMGVTKAGEPWDGRDARQTFYPDASALYDEIDRDGVSAEGEPCALSSRAAFDFFRPCPSGGYTKGCPGSERTDDGDSSDIPPERPGADFFPYYPHEVAAPPTATALARATNLAQRALRCRAYAGCQWLESSCSIEETLYWLSLLLDTTEPVVGHAAQRAHGTIGADGDANIVSGVRYICSRIWEGDDGRDRVGAVLIVDDVAYAAREVAKTDARPGNYEPVGGHGGIVAGLHLEPTLTFIPVRKATWRSDLNLSKLPGTVRGIRGVEVRVLDERTRDLLEIPRVGVVKAGHYAHMPPRRQDRLAPFNGTRGIRDDDDDGGARSSLRGSAAASVLAPGLLADIAAALREAPLAGFVAEGANPYAYLDENGLDAALLKAVFSGLPVVRVARGNTRGFCYPAHPFFIAGSNLTATKARILLQAAILKLGVLPAAADPDNPTPAERDAISHHVSNFQHIFDTH